MAVIIKAGFPLEVGNFFQLYITGCKTMYKWDDFVSGPFTVDIRVGQGSGLSPVLSGLYISQSSNCSLLSQFLGRYNSSFILMTE